MVRNIECCTSGGIDGRKDNEEVRNVASKHQRVSSKCETMYGKCESTESDR
jgi:hypothetical protein